MYKRKGVLACVIVILLLLTDQAIKIAVKLNMPLYDDIEIFSWFHIRFIENNGMAWGMELGSKLLLSTLRIVAVGFLSWYIWKQVRVNAKTGYIVLLSMICAGAAGNIFDSLFYGQIFTESTSVHIATLTSFGEGYAQVLRGKVVDMFYFPLIESTFPEWFPIWGGEHFVFFSPIFNFADACISVAVFILLIFYRDCLNNQPEEVHATNMTAPGKNLENTNENVTATKRDFSES